MAERALPDIKSRLTIDDRALAEVQARAAQANAAMEEGFATTSASTKQLEVNLGALDASMAGTSRGAVTAGASLDELATQQELAARTAGATAAATQEGSAVQVQATRSATTYAAALQAEATALQETTTEAGTANVALSQTDRELTGTAIAATEARTATVGLNTAMAETTAVSAASATATSASTAAAVEAGTVLNNTSTAASALANVETKATRVRREQTTATRSFAQQLSDTSKELGGLGATGQATAAKLTTLDRVIGPGGTLPVGMTALVAGLAAAYIGTKALAGTVGDYLKLTDAVDEYAAITGESARVAGDQIQAFQRLGIAPEAATASVGKLTKAIATNEAQLASHGINVVRNSQGQVDLDKTLISVIDAWNATGDAVERDTIMLAAFGKQGAAMLPVLQAGSKALKDLEAQAGVTFSQDDLDRARKYQLQTQALSQAFSDWKDNIGRNVVPAISAVISKSNENRYVIDRLKESGMSEIQAELVSLKTRDEHVLALRRQYQATEDARSKTNELARQMRDAAKAAQEETDKLNELYSANQADADATIALSQAQLALTHAHQGTTEAQLELTAAVKGYGPNSAAARDATLGLKDAVLTEERAVIDLAGAQVDLAAKHAIAGGRALTDKAQHELLIATLQQLTNQLQPGSALRTALQGYIDTLDRVPSNVYTNIWAQYRISSGGITSARSGPVPRQAGGEMVPGGIYSIGEGGTELAFMNRNGGGQVVPHGQTTDIAAALEKLLDKLGQGGGGTTLMPIVYGTVTPLMQRMIDQDLRERMRRLDTGQVKR